MADIKQAAKWMQEGKEVTRKAWGKSPVRLHANNIVGRLHVNSIICKIEDDFNRSASFTVIELMADDWEIAE